MKHFIIICLFLLPTLLASQEQFSLSFAVSPDISFWTSSEITQSYSKQLPRLGYRMETNVVYQFHPKWSLLAGLGYARMNFRARLKSLQWPSQNNNGQFDPLLSGENVQDIHTSANLFYLPLSIRRQIGAGFYADLETTTNVIFSTNADLIMRPGFGLGLGWEHQTKRGHFLFIQPSFRYIVNKAFKGNLASYNSNPYSIGVALGARVFLK
jgi:hypothetical protein